MKSFNSQHMELHWNLSITDTLEPIFVVLVMAGCGRAPGFLNFFYKKFVCMYIFFFPHPRETIYLTLESSLYANNKG